MIIFLNTLARIFPWDFLSPVAFSFSDSRYFCAEGSAKDMTTEIRKTKTDLVPGFADSKAQALRRPERTRKGEKDVGGNHVVFLLARLENDFLYCQKEESWFPEKVVLPLLKAILAQRAFLCELGKGFPSGHTA